MLLSMLLAALLGQPVLEPVAAALASPARPTIEISLADALRALPVNSASANGSFVWDDANAGGDPPILFDYSDGLAPLLPTDPVFASVSGSEPAERRPAANRARAPPAA